MSDELSRTTEQLRAELRADILAGRGKLPRDSSGRVSAGFLERPEERGTPRTPHLGFQSVGELLASTPSVGIPKAYATKREQLEQLERELAALLSFSAPQLWRQIRAPLRRLLNRARRELRAIDRTDITTLS